MELDVTGRLEKRLDQKKSRRRERRLLPQSGRSPVAFAIFCAIASFLIFAGMTPLDADRRPVSILFLIDFAHCPGAAGPRGLPGHLLIRAWRARTAAAGLDIRIVALFDGDRRRRPTLSMAIVGSVTLDKMLDPAFMHDVAASSWG